MRSIIVALGSLIVGLVLGSIFFGDHTSTFVQPSLAQGPSSTIGLPGTPIVPPLGPRGMDNIGIVGMPQQLDGVNCKGCRFENILLIYSGGQCSCEDCVISQRGILLKGAALNTFNFLVQVGAIPRPHAPTKPVNPNAPTLQTAKLAKAETITLVSLETQ